MLIRTSTTATGSRKEIGKLLTPAIGAALALAAALGFGVREARERAGTESTVAVERPATAGDLSRSAPAAPQAADAPLTVVLVSSPGDVGGAHAHIGALNQVRAENGARLLSPVVRVVTSADDEDRLREWIAAARDGLGLRVEVLDLRGS